MKKKDILELEIQELTDLGEGLAFSPEEGEDRKIFVSYVCPGELIKTKIIQDSKKFARGKVAEILKENPECRVKPKCPYFYKCGGCNLQHLNDDTYYDIKIKLLSNTVKRIGYTPEEVAEILKTAEIKKTGYNSRRRVNFKIEGDILGFYKGNTNDLVSIDSCAVTEKEIEDLIPVIKKFLKQHNGSKKITGLKVSLVDNGLDLCFELDRQPGVKLTERLKTLASENKNIIAIKFFLDRKAYPLFQEENPYIDVEGVRVQMPVDYFLQASVKGQEHIINEVLTTLDKKDIKKVVDLYSGVGTYTFPIAKKLNIEVTAIEGDAEMVKSVKQNSVDNNLQNKIQSKVRDLFNQPLQPEELNKFDAVVINPPRNGAGSQAATLADSDIKNIVMVSCNPSSFMKDARILREGGYKITKIVGVDQFYMSNHLEIVAVFEKK